MRKTYKTPTAAAITRDTPRDILHVYVAIYIAVINKIEKDQ
jgi:hypothetical protein